MVTGIPVSRRYLTDNPFDKLNLESHAMLFFYECVLVTRYVIRDYDPSLRLRAFCYSPRPQKSAAVLFVETWVTRIAIYRGRSCDWEEASSPTPVAGLPIPRTLLPPIATPITLHPFVSKWKTVSIERERSRSAESATVDRHVPRVGGVGELCY